MTYFWLKLLFVYEREVCVCQQEETGFFKGSNMYPQTLIVLAWDFLSG